MLIIIGALMRCTGAELPARNGAILQGFIEAGYSFLFACCDMHLEENCPSSDAGPDIHAGPKDDDFLDAAAAGPVADHAQGEVSHRHDWG